MILRLVLALGILGAAAAPLRAQDDRRSDGGRAGAERASSGPKRGKAEPAEPLPVAGLAGQTVAVLPITLVVADPALKHDSTYATYKDREAALALADSTIGAALAERGPEVKWVLPPALRKMARRSPGMVNDPDEFGQAVLRSPRHKEVPEPLRAELRNLVAVSGGRAVLVPAALGFAFVEGAEGAEGRTVRADLALVLVDARAGKVLWRSVVDGSGGTPDAALDAALATALPLDLPTP